MGWTSLGEFHLNKDWQLTGAVEGEIFRISHKLTHFETFNSQLARGVIAQGFNDGRINIFNSKLFTYKDEDEILALYYPHGLEERALCFKRLDESPDKWSIFVEVFHSENAQDNLNNYLITRFGASAFNMSFYKLPNTISANPKSYPIALPGNESTKILEANLNRTKIRVTSKEESIVLSSKVGSLGEPVDFIAVIPPNHNFEETDLGGSIYKGDVYAFSNASTNVLVIEFSV